MQSILRWEFGAFAIAALTMALPGQTAAGQTRPCLPNCGNVQPQVYKAEVKTTSVQTLADGTTITHEGKQVYARDSQGRTLNAMTGYPFVVMADQSEVTRVTVNDPVENTRSNWDSRSKKARVIKMPPQDQRHGCWVTDSGNVRMNFGTRPGHGEGWRRRPKHVESGGNLAACADTRPEAEESDYGRPGDTNDYGCRGARLSDHHYHSGG